MPTAIHRRVEAARRGENPQVIRKMRSGWAILGDKQFLEGYCLLLPDPVVANLNELKGSARIQYLSDMATLGDAVLAATGAVRINYEILGNVDPALHAHVFPRFPDKEPIDLKTKPVWFYNWDAARPFDSKAHESIMERIGTEIDARVT